jgi:hypothetical protein
MVEELPSLSMIHGVFLADTPAYLTAGLQELTSVDNVIVDFPTAGKQL